MKLGIVTRSRRAISNASRRAVRKVARSLERRLVGALERRFRRDVQSAADRGALSGTNGGYDVARGNQETSHADERTIRRMAEAERHGLSSEESEARYERGENPGGTHAPPSHDDAAAERIASRRREMEEDLEEPGERTERTPGGPSPLPSARRGS